ncbi:MAG: hypothetical protein U9Q97_08680 [Acidobacteriota bacterium]|nr:hypothetical protein [Acidobacteriota bacterium]
MRRRRTALSDTTRADLYLDSKTHRELKARAALENKTMSLMANELLDKALGENPHIVGENPQS